MKRILIAIPTNKYIEPETFKSIYDLKIPNGYTTEFQCFYGYQIDQIRNLIADWGKRYDYLFCVDSDIILPQDTLIKFLAHDKDIISGLYIQRIENTHTLELYHKNNQGGVVNIPFRLIEDEKLIEIEACGFGCVLIKNQVLTTMQYPHFLYQSALNHQNTISEDVYFCQKAKKHGFSIWADVSVKCDHIGQHKFTVIPKELTRFEQLRNQDLLPPQHVNYLKSININPKVIYDIGSSVMHWTDKAKEIWPNAQFYLFDATQHLDDLYYKAGVNYHIGVLSDIDNKMVSFYEDNHNPGGNSYYKENSIFYNESHKQIRKTETLNTIIKEKNWPLPELIKLDIQGAEIDALKGASDCLVKCTDIILEAQHANYNHNAPKIGEVIRFMELLGYVLVDNFCKTDVDGDYHFKKINANLHR